MLVNFKIYVLFIYMMYVPVILFLVCILDKIKSMQDTCMEVFIASLEIEKQEEQSLSIDRE